MWYLKNYIISGGYFIFKTSKQLWPSCLNSSIFLSLLALLLKPENKILIVQKGHFYVCGKFKLHLKLLFCPSNIERAKTLVTWFIWINNNWEITYENILCARHNNNGGTKKRIDPHCQVSCLIKKKSCDMCFCDFHVKWSHEFPLHI